MPDVTEDIALVGSALRGPRGTEAHAALARLEERIRRGEAREARVDEERLRERAVHVRIVDEMRQQAAAALNIAADHVVNVRGLSKKDALKAVREEIAPRPPKQPPPPTRDRPRKPRGQRP